VEVSVRREDRIPLRLFVIPVGGAILLGMIVTGAAASSPWITIPTLVVITLLSCWAVLTDKNPPRSKPDGYVGKFRRADGTVIHVARMPSGRLWAASDTQPPVEVGYVEGRDVARWQKLAGEPDG
jgi:hypothetical protein